MATTTEIIASQIVATYEHLTQPGQFLHLDRIRPHLTGTREQQDAALIEMNGWSDVSIEPQSCQMLLTASQRAAAVSIGNEDKHLIAIGQ